MNGAWERAWKSQKGHYRRVRKLKDHTRQWDMFMEDSAAAGSLLLRPCVQLLDDGMLKRPDQCGLLLPTVKEGVRQAKPFVEALRAQGLTPYNPRSGALAQTRGGACGIRSVNHHS